MVDTAFERTGSVRARLIARRRRRRPRCRGDRSRARRGRRTAARARDRSVFAGVLLIGPVMAKPIARLLGAPVQAVRGITGAMARGNVQRNPKRTARTAAPVLIGVALVTGATVFAASIKAQLRTTIGATVRRRVRDQLDQRRRGQLQPGLRVADPGAARGRRSDRPRLRPAARTRTAPRRSGSAVDGPGAAGAARLPLRRRLVRRPHARRACSISEGEAKRRRPRRSVRSSRCSSTPCRSPLTVQGIYATSTIAQARIYDQRMFDGTGVNNPAGVVFLDRAAGVSDAALRTAVDAVIDGLRHRPAADRATSSSTRAATSSTRA